MQSRKHNTLWCQRLQVILVALTQFRADLRFATRHIVDRTLDRDDALQIEAVDVVDGTDRNLRVGVLHNALNCVARFADDATNQVVVSEDF